MADKISNAEQGRPRKFELDVESDEELEAMQRDFLKNSSRPAAKIVYSNDKSTETAEVKAKKKKADDPVSSSSSMEDFARRMAEAMNEFEVKENRVKILEPAAVPEEPKKKLSLFAQRRRNLVEKNQKEPLSVSGAATFLPKLMAPVPEHQVDQPVKAPSLSNDGGFPEIPADFVEPKRNKAGSSLSQMWEQISQENDSRIQSMSEEEIREAQEEIRSMISKEAIDKLLGKKKKQQQKQVRFAEEEDKDIPPPPPAEWVDESIDVDNNETGVDSAFYQDMKRKYFPKEMVEEAKLAWILGHKQARSPMEKAVFDSRRQDAQKAAQKVDSLLDQPIAHLRFAFDGQIVTEQNASTTQDGLHHHGDDPEKAGYTIPELLHLCRSTVPAQRSVAMSTVGCILHKLNTGAWEVEQSAEVYMGLLEWQTELYIVQGLGDSNMTGRAESAITLWMWVVEMDRYKSLVRMTTAGTETAQHVVKPGADIHLNDTPSKEVALEGVLVERTFKAFDALLSTTFMDKAYEIIDLLLLPGEQLTMLAQSIRTLSSLSDDFSQRITDHGRLHILLENRYPYLKQ